MAKYKLHYYFEVEFDDGTKRQLPWYDEKVYYFHQQKTQYLISWLERLIEEENITAKPLFIREFSKVIECEEYKNYIGM